MITELPESFQISAGGVCVCVYQLTPVSTGAHGGHRIRVSNSKCPLATVHQWDAHLSVVSLVYVCLCVNLSQSLGLQNEQNIIKSVVETYKCSSVNVTLVSNREINAALILVLPLLPDSLMNDCATESLLAFFVCVFFCKETKETHECIRISFRLSHPIALSVNTLCAFSKPSLRGLIRKLNASTLTSVAFQRARVFGDHIWYACIAPHAGFFHEGERACFQVLFQAVNKCGSLASNFWASYASTTTSSLPLHRCSNSSKREEMRREERAGNPLVNACT